MAVTYNRICKSQQYIGFDLYIQFSQGEKKEEIWLLKPNAKEEPK